MHVPLAVNLTMTGIPCALRIVCALWVHQKRNVKIVFLSSFIVTWLNVSKLLHEFCN